MNLKMLLGVRGGSVQRVENSLLLLDWSGDAKHDVKQVLFE